MFYMAELGRFMSRDFKRGPNGAKNQYVYALNNPVNVVDPDGLDDVFDNAIDRLIELIKELGISDEALAQLKGLKLVLGEQPQDEGAAAKFETSLVGSDVVKVKKDILDALKAEQFGGKEKEVVLGNLSKILHELWHAYYEQVVRKGNCKFIDKEEFVKQATDTYLQDQAKAGEQPPETPKGKREEVADEAVGNFIDRLVERMVRDAILKGKKIESNLAEEFKKTSPKVGYYAGGKFEVRTNVEISDYFKKLAFKFLGCKCPDDNPPEKK